MRNAPLAAHAETTAFPPLTCRTWRKIGLHFASDFVSLSRVPEKPKPKPRSGCPVSISLEILGDRWSLLIIRDLMIRGFRTFKEFQTVCQDIRRNPLARFLELLEGPKPPNHQVANDQEGTTIPKDFERDTHRAAGPVICLRLARHARHATSVTCKMQVKICAVQSSVCDCAGVSASTRIEFVHRISPSSGPARMAANTFMFCRR